MRRFLFIIGFLLLLPFLQGSLGKGLAFSLHAQQHNEYIAYAATQNHTNITSPRVDPICPTTPQNTQEPLLNFCSPVYEGVAAGPYGVHITLNGENLPSAPTGWFLSQDQQIKSLSDAQNCTSHPNGTCYKLPSPTRATTSSEPQGTFFSWIWTKGFPTVQSNYYIIATFISLKNHFSTLSTSNTFQLLTSQAPCLSLNNDPCSFSQQTHPIQVSLSKPLTIHGANWILQQNQRGTTEQIQLTASCIKNQSCSKSTVTAIVQSNQIDAKGTFTFSWIFPTSLRGSYHISATNLVPSITNTDNNGTVANQTLSFGTPGDGDGLDITPIPVLPPASSIDIAPFNISAFLAMLPAIAGILSFLFLWSKKNIFAQKVQFAHGIVAIFRPNHQSSTTKPALPAKSSAQINDWAHQQMIASFPLPIVRAYDIPPGKKNPDLDKDIRWAIKRAKNQKDPLHAISLVDDFLFVYPNYWETLRKELLKPFKVSPEQLKQWEQLGIRTTFAVQTESDPGQKKWCCCTALVYYTLYLSSQTHNSEEADIYFDMGFAYLNLAMLGPKKTIFYFLQSAQESYNKALSIYENGALWPLVARTYIALGDIQFAHMARFPLNDPSITNFRNHARESYQFAQEVYQHHRITGDKALEQALLLRKNTLER